MGPRDGRDGLLEHAAGIDEYVGLVFDDLDRILTLLDLHMPHLLFFIPIRSHYSVVEPDELVQVMLLCDILEVLEDLRGTRIALRASTSARYPF